MNLCLVVPRWSSFIALSDIWIVFWGFECGHSEVANECKHPSLKCEGEKGEGVVTASENEMSDSFYGGTLAGVICG